MTSTNTYNNWNSQHPDNTYADSNDITFYYVSLAKAKQMKAKNPAFSSFNLHSSIHTNLNFNITDIPKQLLDNNFYFNNDVSEVLRGDYSRLFFDIDCYELNLLETEEASDICCGLSQIKTILSCITKDYKKYFGGYVETCRESKSEGNNKPSGWISNLLKKYLGTTKNIKIVYNPNTHKEFSAHFYLSKYYFNRVSLYKLFSNFNSKVKKVNSSLADCIDCTVYVRSQRIFRFPFSGKCLDNRKPSPYLPQLQESDLKFMVCGKTDLEDTFISEESETYDKIKTYLNSLRLEIVKSKIKGKEKIKDYVDDFVNEIDFKKYLPSAQSEWYHKLIKQMRYKIIESPSITDDELFNEFIQPKYQYITQRHKNTVINASATKSAIIKAREKDLCLKDVLCENEIGEIKYTINEIVERLKKPVNIILLADIIYNGFIFFKKMTTDNPQCLDLAFLDASKNIKIQTIENFDKIQKANPTKIRLLLNKGFGIQEEVVITLSQAIRIMPFRQTKEEYTIYSTNENKLSLYNQKHIEKCDTLNPYHDKIFDLMAQERTINDSLEFEYTTNQEKKQFIINFFAYIIQHPESRNRICLQISSVPGLGKNMLTNSICQYLGDFAWGNSTVDNVIGNYNGGVDTKLLIVMNEADTKEKNTDKMKSAITEEEIPINIKFGRAYTGINHASYVIFTNHLDTKTIASNDRRFAFIKSDGVPMPKEWYAEMINPEDKTTIRKDLVDNLIGYLMNVDLSAYNSSLAPVFDKQLIYNSRFDKRSIYFKIIYIILHSANKPAILLKDFIDMIKQVKGGFLTFKDFEETKDIPELEDYIDELNEVRDDINNRTIENLINFNDEDDIEIKKWKKRDELRDKKVICLKYKK